MFRKTKGPKITIRERADLALKLLNRPSTQLLQTQLEEKRADSLARQREMVRGARRPMQIRSTTLIEAGPERRACRGFPRWLGRAPGADSAVTLHARANPDGADRPHRALQPRLRVQVCCIATVLLPHGCLSQFDERQSGSAGAA